MQPQVINSNKNSTRPTVWAVGELGANCAPGKESSRADRVGFWWHIAPNGPAACAGFQGAYRCARKRRLHAKTTCHPRTRQGPGWGPCFLSWHTSLHFGLALSGESANNLEVTIPNLAPGAR